MTVTFGSTSICTSALFNVTARAVLNDCETSPPGRDSGRPGFPRQIGVPDVVTVP